jgi:predicted MFS family arabinose efflux permease
MVVGPVIGVAATLLGRGFVFTAIALVLAAMVVITPSAPPAGADKRSPVRAVVELLKVRRAAIGSILIAVIGVINGTLASLAPLLIARRLGSAAAIAAVFVTSYLLASLWNVVLGRVADRVGRLVPVMVGFAVAAGILPFLPSFSSLIPLGIATVVVGSSASGLWTPTAAMVADRADSAPSSQAVAVSVTNASWAAGGAIGAIAMSRIADSVGFAVPFLLVGALCAVAALLCLTMLRGRQAQVEIERSPGRQT